jgi:hypothetical protein
MTISSAHDIPKEHVLHISYDMNKVPLGIQKIVNLFPEMIIGSTGLFTYDTSQALVQASPSFCELLQFLATNKVLDPEILNVDSLTGLNQILQQPQGHEGGFLRKKTSERWHLNDDLFKESDRQTLDLLLEDLGFTSMKEVGAIENVSTCVVFGARVERTSFRIQQTIREINKGLKIEGNIYLLGSNRKLVEEELLYINDVLEQLDGDKKSYWSELFANDSFATEANAFIFLWSTQVPEDAQAIYSDKVVAINSTRIGSSYEKNQGCRVTTEVTIDDMMQHLSNEEKQSIFAVSELPYVRLCDQLRFKVLTNNKASLLYELTEKITDTTFYFVHPEASETPLNSVILDEIARNVFHIVNTIGYIETLKVSSEPAKL